MYYVRELLTHFVTSDISLEIISCQRQPAHPLLNLNRFNLQKLFWKEEKFSVDIEDRNYFTMGQEI